MTSSAFPPGLRILSAGFKKSGGPESKTVAYFASILRVCRYVYMHAMYALCMRMPNIYMCMMVVIVMTALPNPHASLKQ